MSDERKRGLKRSREIEEAIRQVLMRDWDPIQIADEPACADEYDAYIGGVYRLLASNADEAQIATHLAAIETEMMGSPQQAAYLMDVARNLRLIDVSIAGGEKR